VSRPIETSREYYVQSSNGRPPGRTPAVARPVRIGRLRVTRYWKR
jgi:hypothetical protein